MPPTAGLHPSAGHHRIEMLHWQKTHVLKVVSGICLTANLQPVHIGEHRQEAGGEKGWQNGRPRTCLLQPTICHWHGGMHISRQSLPAGAATNIASVGANSCLCTTSQHAGACVCSFPQGLAHWVRPPVRAKAAALPGPRPRLLQPRGTTALGGPCLAGPNEGGPPVRRIRLPLWVDAPRRSHHSLTGDLSGPRPPLMPHNAGKGAFGAWSAHHRRLLSQV
jgi:hypothetical protein